MRIQEQYPNFSKQPEELRNVGKSLFGPNYQGQPVWNPDFRKLAFSVLGQPPTSVVAAKRVDVSNKAKSSPPSQSIHPYAPSYYATVTPPTYSLPSPIMMHGMYINKYAQPSYAIPVHPSVYGHYF